LLRVLNNAYDIKMEAEETAVASLAGGVMQHGYQCGMLWGATLAAGAQAYRLYGPGPRAECAAILAAQRLVTSYRDANGAIDCLEITGIDKSSSTMQMISFFLLKGGSIKCMRKAMKFAQLALTEIETAMSAETAEAPAQPLSCAALLARKLGASELQSVMAAGLAGGIGLCGGGCGALGAAVWILGLKRITTGDGKFVYKSSSGLDAIDTFLRRTDYEFECSAIVGRRFENIADHAEYLHGGGCSALIDALASIPDTALPDTESEVSHD